MLVKNGDRMIVAVKDGCIVGLACGEVYHRTTYIPNTTGQISIIY